MCTEWYERIQKPVEWHSKLLSNCSGRLVDSCPEQKLEWWDQTGNSSLAVYKFGHNRDSTSNQGVQVQFQPTCEKRTSAKFKTEKISLILFQLVN